MRTTNFGARHKASFESAHFNSQKRWGMIRFDLAMAAYCACRAPLDMARNHG